MEIFIHNLTTPTFDFLCENTTFYQSDISIFLNMLLIVYRLSSALVKAIEWDTIFQNIKGHKLMK